MAKHSISWSQRVGLRRHCRRTTSGISAGYFLCIRERTVCNTLSYAMQAEICKYFTVMKAGPRGARL